MSDLLVAYDPSKPAGERLAPEVRDEIQVVAPSTVGPGSIGETQLADDGVTGDKIAPGAVDTVAIATGGVETDNLAAGAVSGDKVQDHTIGPEQVGAGVPTIIDFSLNPVTVKFMGLTAAQYAGISPDPNTWYFIT